ncbi:Protein ltv1 [Hypoxylon texense]
MPIDATISTPLPAGAQPRSVVALLHDHEAYIRATCPQLVSYRRLSGPAAVGARAPVGEPRAFQVTDRRPAGQTTYKLTVTNRPEGVDALVEGRAPTGGMVIKTRWRVKNDGGGGGGGGGDDVGGYVLEEEVEIDSNMITKKMVKGNIEKGHPEYHRSFMAQAAKGKELAL